MEKIYRILKKSSILCAIMCVSIGSSYSQQTYTFTNCSATGRLGPTQTQVNTAYATTNLAGQVVSNNGIQTWTVPATGNYKIVAYGAQGGNSTGSTGVGGLGTKMEGDFFLTGGSVLNIIVGQQGEITTYNTGGGGGTFVWVQNAALPLIVAGGGGGAGYSTNGVNASITNNGTPGVGATGTPGTGGNGANPGGGGWLSPGANFQGASCAAKCSGNTAGLTVGGASPTTAIVYHGCAGTNQTGDGGFGGGSGGNGNCTTSYGGGGGGGYSGGVGQSGTTSGGGGGGSYNAGTNQSNVAAANSGHGKVIITELCSITLNAIGVNANGAICAGNSVTLTTDAVNGYTWSTGSVGASSLVVAPTSNTTYTLTAGSALNCTASAVISVSVNAAIPSLTVNNTSSTNGNGVCPLNSVTLTASGANTYTWTGSVTNGIGFVPSVASGYTVTGENACGTSSAATSVSIHPAPTVTAIASTASLCSGNTATISAVGNGTANTVVVGGTSFNTPLSFFPSATSNYTVTAYSTHGCTNTAVTSMTVVQTPNAAPTSNPPLICIGKSSTLTATGASSYTWAPDGQSTPQIVVSPTITSTYTITKSNANCVDTKTITVIVNQLPGAFAIATPTQICALKTTTLFGGGANTYTWTNGVSTQTQTGTSVIYSPSVTTTYTVAASDGTCVNVTSVTVLVDPNPTITITASTPTLCQGQSVNMLASGGINYTWTATSSFTSNNANVNDAPGITTLYTVEGDNAFNCKSATSQVIIVHNTPTLTASTTKPLVCSTFTSQLNANSVGGGGSVSYTWDANAGGATTPVTIVNPVNTTIYTVTGAYVATGCSSTQTVQVTVFTPVIPVNSPTSSCAGGTINLIAGGGVLPTSYTWTGSNSHFNSIAVSPPSPTVYIVTVLSGSNGVNCLASETISVDIYVNPTVTATSSRTYICRNETTTITADGAVSYNWSDGQSGQTITVGPLVQTDYIITGTDQNGCLGYDTIQIKVSSCTGISENSPLSDQISIFPNPNNGHFSLRSDIDIDLKLYNDFGQELRTISLNGGNQRSVTVQDLPAGIYFISGEKDRMRYNQKLIIH